MPNQNKPHVLRDTGEKPGYGWVFPSSSLISGTRSENLFTGDYSLEGFYEEKTFVIERKGSVTEFVANVSQKEKWADFKDELQRLEEFRFAFLILEFPLPLLLDFPVGSGIPKERWGELRVSPAFLLKRYLEIELNFKTKIIFAGDRGYEVASSLVKRILEVSKCLS